MAQFYLSGIFFNQFYLYLHSQQYKLDRHGRPLAWLVAVLVGLATACAALQLSWHGVTQDRTFESTFMIEWLDAVGPLLGGLVECVVQSHLILRAARLFRHSKPRRTTFLVVMASLIVTSLLFCVLNCVDVFGYSHETLDILPFTWAIAGAIWASTAALIGATITITLFLGLRKPVKRKPNASVDTSVKHILEVGIKTAIPTSIAQLMIAVLAITLGRTSYYYSVVWLAFSGERAPTRRLRRGRLG